MSPACATIDWLRWQRSDSPPRLRALCLPYAGGSGALFRSWCRALDRVQVCTPVLPGRGRQTDGALPRDMDALVDRLTDSVLPLLDCPFVVFGHSMGAAVGHALVTRLQRLGRPTPLRFFASACRPPHLPRRGTPLHERSDAALLGAVHGPQPAGALDRPETRRRLSLLRADLAIYESYHPDPDARIGCPLTAFGGVDDPLISRDELARWRDLTTASFVRRMMPGDHFYLVRNQPQLMRALERELDCVVPG